jgi:Zn-dependent protease
LPLVDYSQLFILFVVLILSLTVHEAAHAWAADLLGDPTAAGLGRLSFNPSIHVDAIGTIIFPLVSFVTGFALIGWATPVPVDVQQLGPGWRWKSALIAAAGPACSLGLAVVAALAIRAGAGATHSPFDAIIAPLLFRAVDLNVLLCVVNVLPVPPLDGGAMLAAVLPPGVGARWQARQWVGVAVMFVLLLSGVLGLVLRPIRASLVGMLL